GRRTNTTVLSVIITTLLSIITPDKKCISELHVYTRIIQYTHAYSPLVHIGSQWVIYIATVVFLYDFKGPV
ncbi:MAG: hypothetical protein CMA94_05220, partial [Euryarchaeota archaeon]|nr:hypothetical protein [Euryarchaeota archaeon]